MEQIKVILPAMGEGIFEATITQWLIGEGESIAEDDSLVEIATDKVDSEIPAPASGTLSKILIQAGEVAKIGDEIAIISTDSDNESQNTNIDIKPENSEIESSKLMLDGNIKAFNNEVQQPSIPFKMDNGKFLSPLVRSIADKENITIKDLELIKGTGLDERITKDDLLNYLSVKKSSNSSTKKTIQPTPLIEGDNIQIIEMGRMRTLIAEHMVHSKHTAPHVTSFHEVDVTAIVKWRQKYKDKFQNRYSQKITFTPIFVDAVVKAIKKFPMILMMK